MKETLDALRRTLERHRSLYDELFALAEEQREHLIARRTDALVEVVNRQGRLIAEESRLDRERQGAMERLASEWGQDGEAMTLAGVIARLDPVQAQPFVTLHQDLLNSAQRLERDLRINASLFETAMDSIRFTLHLFAGVGPSPNPFPLSEDRHGPSPTLMVDQRA